MERVLIGKATTNTTSSYYHRSDKQGLFISRPGANVQNCSDGDLIFDSTAPSLVQVITRGRANIPKQVYDIGFFGEANTITSSNWNSPETEPKELNAKTSWMFGGMDAINSDMTEMRENFAVTFPDGLPDNIEYIGDPNLDPPILSGGYKSNPAFYEIFLLRNEFWNLFTNHGSVNNEGFVRRLIKNYWRILDVFPFFSGTVLGIDFDFNGLLVPSVVTPPANFPEGQNVFPWNIDATGIPVVPEALKPLTISSLEEYLLTETLPGSGESREIDYPANIYYYEPWKSLWNSYITTEAGPSYPATTAYSDELMFVDLPKPWRAWTTPETGKFGILADGTDEEHAAVVTFYKMMVYFSWMYNNFGTQVINNNTPGENLDFDYTHHDTTLDDTSHTFKVSATTSAPSTRIFSEINPTNNFGNTSWTLGAVEISTGVDSQFLGDHPVQIWWNPASAALGDTITNLSFLDIRDHLVKSSTSSERLTSLRPGMSSIHANTYIEDNEIKIKFSQPSTEEGAEVFFTAFKEIAYENTLESNEGP